MWSPGSRTERRERAARLWWLHAVASVLLATSIAISLVLGGTWPSILYLPGALAFSFQAGASFNERRRRPPAA